jgi:hypothetical protein
MDAFCSRSQISPLHLAVGSFDSPLHDAVEFSSRKLIKKSSGDSLGPERNNYVKNHIWGNYSIQYL